MLIKNEKIRKLFLVIFLIALSFLMLSKNLVSNPPGFFIDESIYGYEAYHLLVTAGHSSSGELLPRLFLPQGAYDNIRNHGIFTYLIIPFIAFFGNNEFAVRLTSVFCSVALLFLLYLLLHKRVSQKALFLGLLSWPFIGWVFLLSRIGMEFMAYALFSTVVFTLLVMMWEAKHVKLWHTLLLALSIGVLFYIYAAGKLLALLYLPAAIVLMKKRNVPKSNFVLFFAIIVVTLFGSLRYVVDGSFFYRVDEISQCLDSSCLIPNIFQHLNLSYYFGNTYIPHDFYVLTHSITGTSLLPFYFLPFLLIGFYLVVRKANQKDIFILLLIYSFFISTIPAALTIRGFDSYRSASVLPLFVLVTIMGIDIFFHWMKKISPTFSVTVFGLVLFLFVGFGFDEYIIQQQYRFNVGAAAYTGWQYGYREVLSYVRAHYNDYDHFYVTSKVAYVPHLYINFFDPKNELSKLKIASIDTLSYGKTLYVLRPEEKPESGFTIKKIIYYPDQKHVAYYLGELY